MQQSATRRSTTYRDLLAYVVLSYAVTYFFGWVASRSAVTSPSLIRNLASIILHYGPTLAAILLALVLQGRSGLVVLLRPITYWRVPVRWYLFVLFFPLLVRLLASAVEVLLGGPAPTFFVAGAGSGVPTGISPIFLILPVFVGVLLQAGIAEEIGWRGYALPRLQSRFSALVSSLILAAIWACWHYDPIRGPELVGKGLWYPLAVFPLTIVMTWVYNSTGGSLLLAILYHTASNMADWIVPTTNLAGAELIASARPYALQVGMMWIAALVVLFIAGPEKLTRSSETPSDAHSE